MLKEHKLDFFIQEAPEDPFDPASPMLYRLIARCKGTDFSYALSAKTDDPSDSVAALAHVLNNAALLVTKEALDDALHDHVFMYNHKLAK